MLCGLGLAAAAAAYIELRLMHASTPAEYGELFRWYHVPIFLVIVSQTLFIRDYLGTGSAWLFWAVILTRCVVLIVDFSVDPNFNFLSITALNQISLFGEQVTVIQSAVIRIGWQLFSLASLFLLMAYAIDAAVRRWRVADRESKRKASAIVLSIAIPMLSAFVYAGLLLVRSNRAPVTDLPWFLCTLLLTVIEVGRNFVIGRRAMDQVAELQSQLARTERVSIAGQLASALAHELVQPLSANVLNASTALMYLQLETPNMEELRAVLRDIDRETQRGAEVINRMRQFIKLRTIVMEPLRIEDVVNDVVSMAHLDAITNKVTLSLLMPPDLPRVLGDRVHLCQVLINLLMNSIHAVQSRPFDARRVVVEARVAHGGVQIEVRDSGPGISEDVAAKLFTPFFTTKSDGMGIGLALSKTIIEAHGGHMWFERMNNHDGAMFCFTLQRG
jgi:signal transduction histidine kinase